MRNPITYDLPADLPEDWNVGQIVAPNGSDIGVPEEMGYNYQALQINNAQRALMQVGNAFEGINDIPSATQNLFYNWYFLNPVNQRGKEQYEGSGYTFDCWRHNTSGTVIITDNGILCDSNTIPLRYNIETDARKALIGKTVTFSVLYASGLISGTTVIADGKRYAFDSASVFRTYDTASSRPNEMFSFTVSADNAAIAVKMELGSTQTLAHQENDVWVLNKIPDYSEELLKCQRYYQLYATQSLRPSKAEDCRPVMRTTPTQGTISIGGTTYYYNDANL